jgi:hypothetical protein
MSLDGVIDAPTWTFEYGCSPEDGAYDHGVVYLAYRAVT